ncbi:MAG: desulfoferrodoxin family protein [Candidatus Omnitrophica bacterium]|nr:desulfoferrodoxin family protein [Candidatus Omnitrophota bacterium]MDD5081559.1 desulfoferrodoxin family protein [Candidatus Omnitrophota bacterium]MDD5440640.1 desulfoferrodoxin family protein [Candidatus Omnitrophota bacterium]
MKGIVCKVCSYVAINEIVPEQCPVCGAKSFIEKDDALKTSADKAEKGETEKKHIPDIKIHKACGLIPDACNDVHVKIGEILHPMLTEHNIQHVDLYANREFISRVMFTPDRLNPVASIHLKSGFSGKLAAVELCNVHGLWFNEVDF